jgi:amino acid permease
MAESHENEKNGLSYFVAIAFTMNYIIGSGFLSMPYAFAKSGLLIAFIAVFIMSIFAIVAVNFILETMARADFVINPHPHFLRIPTGLSFFQIADKSEGVKLVVRKERFDIPELCEKFLGVMGKRLYVLNILLYIYGALCAYATIFTDSLNSLIENEYAYTLFLMLFAFIVVPMSLMELEEQVNFTSSTVKI